MLIASHPIADTCSLIGLGVAVAAYGTFVPGSSLWGNVTSRAPRMEGDCIALSFDDGPTPGATDRMLDLLGELDVKVAFFVIGQNVTRAPRLLERMDAEGHLIGNHSFDHSHWAMWRGRNYWQEQVDKTDDAIEQVIGKKPAMFRPPMGIKTWYTIQAARRRGQQVVIWSVRGFDGVATTSQRILNRILPRCSAGDIVSLHDGIEPNAPRDPGPTLDAIKPLVIGLRQRGLTPVRLDELTGLKAYRDSSDWTQNSVPAQASPRV